MAGWSSPTCCPTRSRCSVAGTTRRTRPGSTSPTPWSSRPSSADFAPSARLVLLKGVSRGGLRLLHQHRLPQGHRAGRQPAVRAALPVAPARAAGPRRRHRQPCSRGPRSTPTSRSARAARSSAPGPRTSPASSPAASELHRGVRRRGAALRRRRRADARRSGAATSCTRSRWSSGRAGRAGCTTGWSTGVAGTAGAPSGSHRSRQMAHSDHARRPGSDITSSLVIKHMFRGSPRLLIARAALGPGRGHAQVRRPRGGTGKSSR